jgi:hypothetical protein
MELKQQSWIYSKYLDGIFILSPPFFSLLLVFLFPSFFQQPEGMPVAAWIILILMVDVAHVYSTLYRTYFDKETFANRKTALLNIPLFCFIGGVLLYFIGAQVLWRVIAYLAVFHFIRQQYGFMRIYSRKESSSGRERVLDVLAIYAASLFPIIYWHLHGPLNFNWFVERDFYFFSSRGLAVVSFIAYVLIIGLYLVKEINLIRRLHTFNIPRNTIVVGTFLSWYFGIVYFNGDLAFTTINVLSHGIPYMALIWIYGRKKYFGGMTVTASAFMKYLFSYRGLLIFLGLLVVFAYIEEGFWDAMIWADHPRVFRFFYVIPRVQGSDWLCILVPLLSLPQVTHYVIDGFIWKLSKDRFNWRDYTLGRKE